MSTLLSVRGLAKSFGDLQALRGVSFDAHSGEIVAVIGPNGAGKTTLLSIIAGAQRQSAGTVRCDAAGASHDVGWAPQQAAVYSKLSVSENLRLFARLHRVADPERAVARMLEQTGLAKRAGERLERLSGGNRQRVNVAIGLIADPPVLVLDEPSASLDPGQRERLWEFVAGLAKAGRGVIFSTHNVDEAQRYADRVIVLDRGDLRFDGTPGELMRAAGEDVRGDLERALVAFLARDEPR
ncbi:MAG: ABC transporter ATP-binding protein [Actinobacteria bacterium]|nr:MAG: ABC transporter ATP-binding protein [Actinomycetota bacterium]